MLVKKNTLTFIFCVLIFFSTLSQSWSRSVEKQAVLAVLTLNIARFTHWPEHSFNHTKTLLNLCVFGDNVVQQSFENINNKAVNNKTIQIIHLSRLRNLKQCHLLYLGNLKRNKLTPLLMELIDQPILTIGEDLEFLQSGGMVGLEKINGKIQLIINLARIKRSELVISSRLLKLAKIVNFLSPAH